MAYHFHYKFVEKKKNMESSIDTKEKISFSSMALISNIFGCFSESEESRQYVCEGDVCVLRNKKKSGNGRKTILSMNKPTKQRNNWNFFAIVTMRRASTT
ncbi:hypothetical protein DITRI_Ditri14bG0137200 [Diplodiscus trichospermus]